MPVIEVPSPVPKQSPADKATFALQMQVAPVDMTGWPTERRLRLIGKYTELLHILDEQPPELEVIKP